MPKMICLPFARQPALACVLALALAPAAQARNVSHMLAVAEPLAQARAGDGVASVQGVGVPLLKPQGGEPISDEVCANALRDALKRLALAARKAGGHAVVGIVSTYNGDTIDDPAQVECRMGESKALAPPSGVIVRALPAAWAAK